MSRQTAQLDRLSTAQSVVPDIVRSPCFMEDFCEADILWPENCSDENHGSCRLPSTISSSFPSPASHYPLHRRQRQNPHAVAPIGIPAAAGISNSMSFRITCDIEGNYWVEDEEADIDPAGHHGKQAEIVPPHLLIASRRASGPCHQKMAFSVCTGHGRTLKGRDLSQVRDWVLRLTGFLEPEAFPSDAAASR